MTLLFLFFVVVEEDLLGGYDDVLALPAVTFDVLFVGNRKPTFEPNLGLNRKLTQEHIGSGGRERDNGTKRGRGRGEESGDVWSKQGGEKDIEI